MSVISRFALVVLIAVLVGCATAAPIFMGLPSDNRNGLTSFKQIDNAKVAPKDYMYPGIAAWLTTKFTKEKVGALGPKSDVASRQTRIGSNVRTQSTTRPSSIGGKNNGGKNNGGKNNGGKSKGGKNNGGKNNGSKKSTVEKVQEMVDDSEEKTKQKLGNFEEKTNKRITSTNEKLDQFIGQARKRSQASETGAEDSDEKVQKYVDDAVEESADSIGEKLNKIREETKKTRDQVEQIRTFMDWKKEAEAEGQAVPEGIAENDFQALKESNEKAKDEETRLEFRSFVDLKNEAEAEGQAVPEGNSEIQGLKPSNEKVNDEQTRPEFREQVEKTKNVMDKETDATNPSGDEETETGEDTAYAMDTANDTPLDDNAAVNEKLEDMEQSDDTSALEGWTEAELKAFIAAEDKKEKAEYAAEDYAAPDDGTDAEQDISTESEKNDFEALKDSNEEEQEEDVTNSKEAMSELDEQRLRKFGKRFAKDSEDYEALQESNEAGNEGDVTNSKEAMSELDEQRLRKFGKRFVKDSVDYEALKKSKEAGNEADGRNWKKAESKLNEERLAKFIGKEEMKENRAKKQDATKPSDGEETEMKDDIIDNSESGTDEPTNEDSVDDEGKDEKDENDENDEKDNTYGFEGMSDADMDEYVGAVEEKEGEEADQAEKEAEEDAEADQAEEEAEADQADEEEAEADRADEADAKVDLAEEDDDYGQDNGDEYSEKSVGDVDVSDSEAQGEKTGEDMEDVEGAQ